MLTLLLLSGGGHTGANIMATLIARRESLRLVATSDIAHEPSLFAFDAVYLAPMLAEDPEAFERRILDIIEREQPQLVVPCRDEDVQWLAGLRERRPDLATRLLCGNRDVAEVVNDKWLSYEFCRRHGLPFAESLLLDASVETSGFVAQVGLPLVAKPRHGVNAAGILLLTTSAQVDRARLLHDYVLQQYLGDAGALHHYVQSVADDGVPLFHSFLGQKRSIQIMIAPDGTIDYIACTLNQMSGRISRSIAWDHDPEARRIGERCARVFADAGWRGPLNIQCQPAPNGELIIHEFNARFTGATSARWQLGIDEIGTAIRLFAGRHIVQDNRAHDWPVVAVESLAALAAGPANINALATHGYWQREHG